MSDPSAQNGELALNASRVGRYGVTRWATATDSSPFANNGVYTDGPVLGLPGVLNTAVGMDGVNDTVRVPDSGELARSRVGWVKPTAHPSPGW